jgi:hypothetical protein
MHKKVIIVLALLSACFTLSAQWKEVGVSDTSRWNFHLSTGVTIGSGWGKTNALFWTAPRVEYRASERLTLRGGFATVGSLLPGYELQMPVRSYAPRRQGTRLLGGFASASYQVNPRLNIWASIQHVGGWYEPLWTPQGEALDMSLTAFSGGFAYELSNHSLFEMHFHIVHDHYGNSALGLLGHPYYGIGVPSWELYSGPWGF